MPEPWLLISLEIHFFKEEHGMYFLDRWEGLLALAVSLCQYCSRKFAEAAEMYPEMKNKPILR